MGRGVTETKEQLWGLALVNVSVDEMNKASNVTSIAFARGSFCGCASMAISKLAKISSYFVTICALKVLRLIGSRYPPSLLFVNVSYIPRLQPVTILYSLMKSLVEFEAVMSLVWLKFWLVGWQPFQNRNRLELFLTCNWLVTKNIV